MAPSTTVSQLPQADATAATTTTNNGNGATTKDRGSMKLKLPKPVEHADPFQQRQHLKERLALGFRIFAKNGFDAGVAGHITVRVRPALPRLAPLESPPSCLGP